MLENKKFVRHKVAAVGFFWLLLLLGWQLPVLLDRAASQWENAGDAKFYAECARHYLESGNFHWFEIYPVALQAGKGPDMAWTAIGFPAAVAGFSRLSGMDTPNSAIWVSVLSWTGCALVIFVGLTAVSGQVLAGLAGSVLFCCLGKSRAFAASGGTESLSQLFMLLSLVALFGYFRRPGRRMLVLGYGLIALGVLIRPHNQFLWLASVLVPISAPQNLRRWAWGLWLLVPLWQFGVGRMVADPGDWRFPYLFSFLVATPDYPGHSLFRTYVDGFGMDDLWSQRQLLWEKARVGWKVLKAYWDQWLPQVSVLAWTVLWSRRRLPSMLALLLLFVYALSLFFAGMGHLVARYFEILEPLALIVVAGAAMEGFGRENSGLRMAAWVVGSLGLVLVAWDSGWPGKPGELKSDSLPDSIVKALPSQGFVACDRPAAIIGAVHRQVMLCPEDLENLDRIEKDIARVSAILFTPNLARGELSHWQILSAELPERGYRRIEASGWIMYVK